MIRLVDGVQRLAYRDMKLSGRVWVMWPMYTLYAKRLYQECIGWMNHWNTSRSCGGAKTKTNHHHVCVCVCVLKPNDRIQCAYAYDWRGSRVKRSHTYHGLCWHVRASTSSLMTISRIDPIKMIQCSMFLYVGWAQQLQQAYMHVTTADYVSQTIIRWTEHIKIVTSNDHQMCACVRASLNLNHLLCRSNQFHLSAPCAYHHPAGVLSTHTRIHTVKNEWPVPLLPFSLLLTVAACAPFFLIHHLFPACRSLGGFADAVAIRLIRGNYFVDDYWTISPNI